MEPSCSTSGSNRKRHVDSVTDDGDAERVYRFTVLLPNGTSVGITIRDPDTLMPLGDFVLTIKRRYILAKAQDPSLKLKRPIAWENEDLYIEDANGDQIKRRIIFDNFKPYKRHIIHLHDGSGNAINTFEDMWDLTPDTELLKELPEEYNFETALADLIDNSLQAVWANPPKSRLISLDISDEKISIFDTGPGMDASDESSITKWGKMGASLHRKFKAMAVGGKPPYLMPFFGLFGYGGPIASMHLGRHAVVSSKTMKSKRVYMLHLKREALLSRSGSQHSWKTTGGFRVPLEIESARAPQGSFTKVEIFKPRTKKVNLHQLQCKLKDIYFPYIQCDGLSDLRRTTRPVYFEVNGTDLAEIKGGEVAITNSHSCNGPDFIIEVHFSITQDTDANRIPGSTAIHEANACLKCVYFPVVQGKETIERILEELEADGCRVAETYESFSRVSIRRLGRLLPDARWGLLPFMEERRKRGDKAHLFRRSFFRVKCFIDTDAGFSPTPSKTDLAQHSPFTCALKKIGRPLDEVKEIKVKICREGKLLTPLQLEKEYCDWIIQMHKLYDEEVDSGEDQAVFILNPGNKKALGVSSNVLRVHRRMKRKGVSWRRDQKIKILKGACAGVHNNNVYATLEYFLLEGLQGDGGGEARIICRPLGVPDEKGCMLNKHEENVCLEVQSSVSIPIGVIDSGELVAVGKSEWECQLEKHRSKSPSSIDLLDSNQCEELGVHSALPVHAPIPAGQDPPKEIVAVVRPANFCFSTAPKNLDQKYIVKNRMEMSMEVKFSGNSDNGQERHIYSSRVTPSFHRGFHGLYIFSLQHKSHELFQKAGVYKFLFRTDETSCKNCEKEVTVHASAEVGRWQLLGYDQNKHLQVRVGSCFAPLDVACYDRYGNLIQLPSTPKVDLQFKMGKGTLIYVKKMKAGLSANKKTLRIKDLLVESGDLDIIRPSYEGTMLICPPDDSLSISIPCRVIPGHVRRVLAHPSTQSIQMLPGCIVQELKLEMFDAYGNHALEGSEVLLKVEGFSFKDQMGKKLKVDHDGFVHLGGMLKVTAGYGQDVSLSIIARGEEIFREEFQTEKRELRVAEPIGIQPSSDLQQQEIQTLCPNRIIMMLQDTSTPNDVENALSIIKNEKILENDILETGLRIGHREKALKLLHERKAEIEQSLVELGEPSPLNIMDCFFTKEEMIDRIENRNGSAASTLCELTEGPHRRSRNGIIGVVALLGTVCNIELSRMLAKYLGVDKMLGIVCANSETAFSLEAYDQNGEVDLQNAVYAKAAELGKFISGEFRVICLEEISPYIGEFEGFDRKLALPFPTLPSGEIPLGFLGYAVNMVDIDVDHLATRTVEGLGLRETLFYQLFGKLQVYDTREHMKQARVYIDDGAVSLDGGIIREDDSISLGFWKPDIFFPVVPSAIQNNASPERTQRRMQIEEAMSELRVTLLEIRKVTRACEEARQQFFEKTGDFRKLMGTAEAFVKNHYPKSESRPDNLSPPLPRE
ncbi:structural maintenance of chromosomes flexible hinge domain-containing protein GMI1 isoform X2 [Rhodamnia argentea]|uniref:Structural maintenance of chromosomes flexible hinge domain-containing protein GMI1 isoform X2 n=1 Tax=Rhodamnia argentea TaxID=178133 RepID=A0ABM3HR02_9MYRT|nr:structural maintenance of chromosomes flexible hinge domain-containing protein GMI1 isoform X2 [Rhodamnia argentea]